jgi:SAM-dependent methyltransferase
MGLLLNRPVQACGNRLAPSAWIVRWAALVAQGASVLDVACGCGRHSAWFAARGHGVTALDRDLSKVQDLVDCATLVSADIENGPWPLCAGGVPVGFGAVVVTNYLWRPLMHTLVASVAPGGVLLYETFAAGNETVGRPARPDYLLRRGELLQHCRDLDVVAYEHGYLDDPARYVQRIAAVRPFAGGDPPRETARHPL